MVRLRWSFSSRNFCILNRQQIRQEGGRTAVCSTSEAVRQRDDVLSVAGDPVIVSLHRSRAARSGTHAADKGQGVIFPCFAATNRTAGRKRTIRVYILKKKKERRCAFLVRPLVASLLFYSLKKKKKKRIDSDARWAPRSGIHTAWVPRVVSMPNRKGRERFRTGILYCLFFLRLEVFGG